MKIIAHRASQRSISHPQRVQRIVRNALYRSIEQRITEIDRSMAERRAIIERLKALPAYTHEQSLAELRTIMQAVEQTLDTCDALDRDLGRNVQALA